MIGDVKTAIIQALGETIQLLGGDHYILSVVKSTGDTLPDEEILELVNDYNATMGSDFAQTTDD